MGGYEGQAIPSEETDENEAQVLKCPVFDTKISRKNPEILTVYFVFEPVRPCIKVIRVYAQAYCIQERSQNLGFLHGDFVGLC